MTREWTEYDQALYEVVMELTGMLDDPALARRLSETAGRVMVGWEPPTVGQLLMEQTPTEVDVDAERAKQSEAPGHYHCALCHRVISAGGFTQVSADGPIRVVGFLCGLCAKIGFVDVPDATHGVRAVGAEQEGE